MHNCYLKVLEEMGYKVVTKKDEKEISIIDKDGNELDSKDYYLEEIKANVTKFTDKISNREISLYNDSIVEIKIDDTSTAILSYDDEKKAHTFYVKYHVSEDNRGVKSIKIKVCNNDAKKPGYITMRVDDNYGDSIVLGDTMYYVSGGNRDPQGISVDNFMEIIDETLLDKLWDESKKKGYDTIIPGVRVCVRDMISFWEAHLNYYLKRYQTAINRLQGKINQYNQKASSIQEIINDLQEEKSHISK